MGTDETNVEGQVLTPGAEVQPEGPAVSTEQPEPAAEKPEVTVEDLQKQLDETRKNYSVLEANYKANQRNLEAARRVGPPDPETRKLLEDLREQMAATQDDIDAIKIAGGYEAPVADASGAPKKTRVESIREQRAAQEAATKDKDSAREIMSNMLVASGLSPEALAPAVEPARIAFESGKYQDAVKLFAQGVAQAKSAPAATGTVAGPLKTAEQQVEELANVKAMKILKDRGLLNVDLGGPSAASPGSFEQVEEKYIKGEVSAKVYEDALKKHQGG
jgi:hypothetical protein